MGYDAGKRIKGRKRHLLVDTLGMLLEVCVSPASTGERSGAKKLLEEGTGRAGCVELVEEAMGGQGIFRKGVCRLGQRASGEVGGRSGQVDRGGKRVPSTSASLESGANHWMVDAGQANGKGL